MRIAFYAPLKPPDSPVPSGDREIARLLMKALERGGHEVSLLSRFRAFEHGNDFARRRRLENAGKALAARYVRRLSALPAESRPQAVFTYHVYDKAPDWIGPAVASALAVPYLICEASLNPARAGGANAGGHDAAREAIAAADTVIELNSADRAGIAGSLKPGARIVELPPFIDTGAVNPATANRDRSAALKRTLADELGLEAAVPWLLTVAMMRAGDKLKSYRVLAEALARLRHGPWRLLVAGDGPARDEVEGAFAPFGDGRVLFLGRQDADSLSRLYRGADLFVWPAVNEALGLAILEAQAAGLPVVAGRHGAIGQIVRHGVTGLLVAERDSGQFADAVAALLDDPTRAAAMGAAARENARCRHDITGAAHLLNDALADAALRSPSHGETATGACDGVPRSGGSETRASPTGQAVR